MSPLDKFTNSAKRIPVISIGVSKAKSNVSVEGKLRDGSTAFPSGPPPARTLPPLESVAVTCTPETVDVMAGVSLPETVVKSNV